MEFLGGRISVAPAAVPQGAVPLTAALIGHCPGLQDAERLLANTRMTERIRAAGFAAKLTELDARLAQFKQRLARRINAAGLSDTADAVYERLASCAQPGDDLVQPGDLELLRDLPIPISSAAEFEVLFPCAATRDTQSGTTLAGSRAWLPGSVQDFFAAGGRSLWVVPVSENPVPAQPGVEGLPPEAPGPGAFRPRLVPTGVPNLAEPASLRGFHVVLALQEVGVVAAPDLERLWIPAHTSLTERTALPLLDFVPKSEFLVNTEEVLTWETRPAGSPDDWIAEMGIVCGLIERFRPDLAYVATLPLSNPLNRVELDGGVVDALVNGADSDDAEYLKRFMFLFPYLTSEAGVVTAVGRVLGLQSRTAREQGIWHSIAGHRLTNGQSLVPAQSAQQVEELREQGISVMHNSRAGITLDSEATVRPALAPGDLIALGARAAPYRSHTLSRFIGYLIRELQRLGDSLLFTVDPQDPRPGLAVERFLARLYELGGLRGARPVDAYRITTVPFADNVISLDVEVAPAMPVGQIRLQFRHTGEAWKTEVAGV